jgi:hypothetical protein
LSTKDGKLCLMPSPFGKPTDVQARGMLWISFDQKPLSKTGHL